MMVEILSDFVTVQFCDKQRLGRLRGTTPTKSVTERSFPVASDNLHLSQQN